MTAPLLAIRDLRAAYGKIEALKGVDLDIQSGEIVALIGANGAGKSTLMMTIFGKPRASAGQILFDGRDLTAVPTHEIARLRIAQSPEGRRIFPRMSVAENLQMGADATDTSETERESGLERVFSLFPRLKERMTQRGGTLSGGEQQMLAIGRALMSRPRLLLLDEPSLGLAPLIARLRIAQSPEGRRIFPRMSVAENLQMGADATDTGEAERESGLERVFSLFPRLKERMTQRGGTLSGGEQQMLAIGRALMSRPRLLLLDEPSLGLAPLIARQIFDAIRTLNRQDGLTVLIVEQNANHALKLAHRGYVLVNGLITLAGTGGELLQRPEIRAAYLEGGRRS